jgi:hypothetical protein
MDQKLRIDQLNLVPMCSTLMDLLSGRRLFGKVTGTMRVGNEEPGLHTRLRTAYVMQVRFRGCLCGVYRDVYLQFVWH